MQFAVNYSREAEYLVENSLIDVDLFKCPDFSESLIQKAQEIKPCYIHFGLNAGSRQLNHIDWDQLFKLKQMTQTPYVNVHAVAFCEQYPGMDVLTEEPSHIERIIDAVVNDINKLGEAVGIENVIMENVICRGPGENMFKAIIEPNVLTEIVNRTGCSFLLDIAHAQLSALSLGFNVKDYISRMPITNLKELHITGIQKDKNGRLRDSMPMTENDWDLANWTLNNIKTIEWPEPWVVALEYGGVGQAFEWRSDQKVLIEQVPKLYEMVKTSQ
ncbi:multinuclear nonheme iron-dependent oxidase [Piscibacillus salipiscarius]|uniref:DUF692 family multinuclear iron-containing protein n=1 Tax=Piscibacillus salipiscarius TaxID=299480 RepID=A0ABW5Q5R0_9BACI|nr:DUF692 family multinuclear iron-containing protein [Piscibacillus salipiscarius]